MKVDYDGEQSRDSVLSEIAALSLRTGRPARHFYRLKARLTGFGWLAILLAVLVESAVSLRFPLHGWRAIALPFAFTFAVTNVWGRFFPLVRFRIVVKRGEPQQG